MKKYAFTLAEVLITLTIIGIIAALTIPNLMKKWEDHEQVARCKEAYSIFSNALKMAIAENGSTDTWQNSKSATLSQYLKIKQNCEISGRCLLYGWNSGGTAKTTYGTWSSYWKRADTGTINYWGPNCQGGNCGIILENGMRARIQNGGDILVDTNGTNYPNRFGYDVFYFSINNNLLIPNHSYYKNKNYCNPTVTNGSDGSGLSCAYWVIKHGNMDYKYRDISAEW